MTSQNSENCNRSSSPIIANNNNCIVGQGVLMKDRNRNQINNKNILVLNRTTIAPNYNVKNSKFVQISPTTSSHFLTKKTNVRKLIQSGDEALFDSDIEIIDDCEDVPSGQKFRNSKDDLGKFSEGSLKKETPLLQIFDGNVVISQELSIEEVQNLLIQINSKLQNQNSVNSADFPNIAFSKEENSDVEIILDDGNEPESGRKDIATSKISNILGTSKAGKWIGQTFDSNNRKVLLKSLSVSDKVGGPVNQPSTSSETNLLISFKAFGDRKLENTEFEHDYSNCKVKSVEDGSSKKDEPMVEHVIVENADSELMQIELIETSSGSVSASTVSSSNCATDKAGD